MFHQNINSRTQCRVGGDAGITIGATALQRHDKIGGKAGLAFHVVDRCQHLPHIFNTLGHSLARAAGFLNCHCTEQFVLFDLVGFLEARNLEAFAAQAHHHDATHVGIGGIAPGRALEGIEDDAAIINDAAIVLRQRNDAVNIGVVLQHAGTLYFAGNV